MEYPEKVAIQDEYHDDFAWCYGCGRLNETGLHLRTTWHGSETVTYYEPKAEHTAIPGFVYGGLLASIIDCHGTGSAALLLHRKNGHEPGDGVDPPRFVTASLKVDFKKPTEQNKVLKAVGKVVEIHPKRFRVDVEVFAEAELVVTGIVEAVLMPKTFSNK